jgi:hypothetical protein
MKYSFELFLISGKKNVKTQNANVLRDIDLQEPTPSALIILMGAI